MDNYFILSYKVGDKWTKVTSDMTSVKLETCIHIIGKLILWGDFSHGYLTDGGEDHHSDHHFSQRVHSDSETHSIIQSMNP
jgi:hypothetical protein